MKVMITGCNGQLGKELQKIITTGTSELGAIDARYHNCELVCVDADVLDITNSESVMHFVQTEKPDVLINCAAYTNVNKCEDDLDNAFCVNSLGPANLAKACEQYDVKFCHISTDYVFDGMGNQPFTELDLCAPQSAYGSTKLLGEMYTREFCSRYFIIRTAWLYGYEGNNFVYTVRKIASEQGYMKVVNDQFGNPTNANELAYHILKIIITNQFGIYHCTGNGICSWYDFAKKIVELSNIDAKIEPCTTEEYPTPAKRPAFSALDHMMLRCTVKDEMSNWEDALTRFIHEIDCK